MVMAVFAQTQQLAGAGILPAGVKAFRDVAYVENGHARQKLDLYLPAKSDGPLPLVRILSHTSRPTRCRLF